MPLSVWIVDDDEGHREVVRFLLGEAGFECRAISSGLDLLAALREGVPDLVLLDLGLPDQGGLELLEHIRSVPATKHLPVIVVTASQKGADRYTSFQGGCDDYILKPFDPVELVLRVKARLRRELPQEAGGDAPESLTAGDLELDLVFKTVDVGGARVSLTASEFRILRYLMERPDRPSTAADLMVEALGYPAHVAGSDTIRNHIRSLRRKIEADPSMPARLINIPGLGYLYKTTRR